MTRNFPFLAFPKIFNNFSLAALVKRGVDSVEIFLMENIELFYESNFINIIVQYYSPLIPV